MKPWKSQIAGSRRRAGSKRRAVEVRWVATGTLAAWTLVWNGAPALAEERVREGLAGTGPSSAPASEQPVLHYQIPPGPLGVVIAAFEAASGVTVTAPHEAIRDIQSPGVSGTYTADPGAAQAARGHRRHVPLHGARRRDAASCACAEAIEVTAPLATAVVAEVHGAAARHPADDHRDPAAP